MVGRKKKKANSGAFVKGDPRTCRGGPAVISGADLRLICRSTSNDVGPIPEDDMNASKQLLETSRLRPAKGITKNREELTRADLIKRIRSICDKMGLDRGWVSAQIKKFSSKSICAVCDQVFATHTTTKTINGRAAHLVEHAAILLLVDHEGDDEGDEEEANEESEERRINEELSITHKKDCRLRLNQKKSRYDCGFCGEELRDEKSKTAHALQHLNVVDFDTAERTRSRAEWLSWRSAVLRRLPRIHFQQNISQWEDMKTKLTSCGECLISFFGRSLHYKVVHCLSHLDDLCVGENPTPLLDTPLTANEWRLICAGAPRHWAPGACGPQCVKNYFWSGYRHSIDLCSGCDQLAGFGGGGKRLKRKNKLIHEKYFQRKRENREPSLLVPKVWTASLFEKMEMEDEEEEEEESGQEEWVTRVVDGKRKRLELERMEKKLELEIKEDEERKRRQREERQRSEESVGVGDEDDEEDDADDNDSSILKEETPENDEDDVPINEVNFELIQGEEDFAFLEGEEFVPEQFDQILASLGDDEEEMNVEAEEEAEEEEEMGRRKDDGEKTSEKGRKSRKDVPVAGDDEAEDEEEDEEEEEETFVLTEKSPSSSRGNRSHLSRPAAKRKLNSEDPRMQPIVLVERCESLIKEWLRQNQEKRKPQKPKPSAKIISDSRNLLDDFNDDIKLENLLDLDEDEPIEWRENADESRSNQVTNRNQAINCSLTIAPKSTPTSTTPPKPIPSKPRRPNPQTTRAIPPKSTYSHTPKAKPSNDQKGFSPIVINGGVKASFRILPPPTAVSKTGSGAAVTVDENEGITSITTESGEGSNDGNSASSNLPSRQINDPIDEILSASISANQKRDRIKELPLRMTEFQLERLVGDMLESINQVAPTESPAEIILRRDSVRKLLKCQEAAKEKLGLSQEERVKLANESVLKFLNREEEKPPKPNYKVKKPEPAGTGKKIRYIIKRPSTDTTAAQPELTGKSIPLKKPKLSSTRARDPPQQPQHQPQTQPQTQPETAQETRRNIGHSFTAIVSKPAEGDSLLGFEDSQQVSIVGLEGLTMLLSDLMGKHLDDCAVSASDNSTKFLLREQSFADLTIGISAFCLRCEFEKKFSFKLKHGQMAVSSASTKLNHPRPLSPTSSSKRVSLD